MKKKIKKNIKKNIGKIVKIVSRDQTDVLLNEQKWYKPLKTIVKQAKIQDLEKMRKEAARNPLKFWENAAKELAWMEPWKKVLEEKKAPFYQWFVGGKCNIVENALDRHIGTPIERKNAILWEGNSGKSKRFTYGQLYRAVNRMANGLKHLGVVKGDRVVIYLQNIPETAISMLAAAKIGAVHSVVYGGFSAHALKTRVEDAEAKVVVTSDIGYRRDKTIDMKSIVDEVLQGCKCVQKVIVVKQNNEPTPTAKKRGSRRDTPRRVFPETHMEPHRDVFYNHLIAHESEECPTERMDAEDPLFILYTSGTTGTPKGVVHVHGGYMVGIHKTFQTVFDIQSKDTFWCTADPGWITGHSYTVYAPLMAGITTILFEGVQDYPKPDRLWNMVEKYNVTIFYTAPTLIRALMRYGDQWPKKHNLNSLRLLGSVGEPINPEAWRWYYTVIGQKKCPIMDTWWQTETGMFMITPFVTMSLKASSATKPFPGIQAEVVDAQGKKVAPGKGGYLVIKNPWPAMLRTIYKNPKRYLETYWKKIPGWYLTGDMAHKDKDGYFWIQGRSDDVLKIAGHRIGSVEVESALVSHPSVAEAGVIGKPDPVKGETIKAFVVLKKGVSIGARHGEELKEKLKNHVRHEIGPIAVMEEIEYIDQLPKTRSGKIMRRVLRARELGQDAGDVSTLAD
ncbi:acetate--CoA ligase [Candidatus Peregrinibacteria bacterium]|nr:acetate--CoA ligase [Candidatus Peregrinibacteria bacterium]